ncbi:hypothetical protein SDRG_06517 [Saprolegnia diclina VS20]|uniref:START domain-containing protein n=1 Tax=Saprolegnia diclina (strain VS20) TaxID=1156394 RepID=T0RTD5_SAPDV|nr:hypothetical protein SDRG_06517 [Saprolegnia diclina VS20]EQC35758.1 hypothetical protein SDRG_06517 [Saprolegnia diclina VS20]|eukprot:XP_008610520.1 hypothetical protein SDRG_06517 [Saprolegnia diclina VS20]
MRPSTYAHSDPGAAEILLPDPATMTELVAGICDDLAREAPPRTKQQIATLKHRKKQQDELAYLKATVHTLHTELARLTTEKSPTRSASRWERLAKGERKRQHDSQRENRRLKEMLEEQVQFAECLVNLVRKRPKMALIADNEDDQWRQLVLVADPALRRIAIPAIVDRVFADLDSAFIEAGLIESPLHRHEYVPKITLHHTLEIQTIVCVPFPAAFGVACEAVWRVLRGSVPIPQLNGSYRLLHEVDVDTTYVAGVRRHAALETQRRVVVKRYHAAPARFAVICRSIHADALYPMDSNCAHSNEVSWLTVEPLSLTASMVKFFQKSSPTKHDGAALDAEYLMEAFSKNTVGFEVAILDEIRTLL